MENTRISNFDKRGRPINRSTLFDENGRPYVYNADNIIYKGEFTREHVDDGVNELIETNTQRWEAEMMLWIIESSEALLTDPMTRFNWCIYKRLLEILKK